MSRQNRRNPAAARSLAYVLGERGQLLAPGDLDALASSLEHFRAHEIEVLCINGGDGTVHQAVTALVNAYGESTPLPPIAVLRSGTMNIIADSIGVKVTAESMLDQVVDAYHRGDALPEHNVRLLRVEIDDDPPRYGFLAGNGVIAGFLEVYYAKADPAPLDAALLLARGAASAVVGGQLVTQLLRPWRGNAILDGTPLPGREWVTWAIGTVEEMGFGFRVFHLIPGHPDKMQVVGIGSSVGRLAAELPGIYAGRGVRHPANHSEVADELVLEGTEPFPLMVDGDLYVARSARVRIGLGPRVRMLLPR